MTDPLRQFALYGQVRGGKNNIGITRTGRRFPSKPFAIWSKKATAMLRIQMLAYDNAIISMPVIVTYDYWPGDLRKRDCTAIQDAMMHVMEAAHIIADDSQIQEIARYKQHPVDRKNPRICFTLNAIT